MLVHLNDVSLMFLHEYVYISKTLSKSGQAKTTSLVIVAFTSLNAF